MLTGNYFRGRFRDKKLHAVRAARRALRWQVLTDGPIYSSAIISADGLTIFVGSDDHNLYAVNSVDGSLKWEYATGGRSGAAGAPC